MKRKILRLYTLYTNPKFAIGKQLLFLAPLSESFSGS